MRRTTRKAGAFDRLVAAVLTVALAGYWVPAMAYARESQPRSAEIGGLVLLPDGLTPVSGVSVKAANVDTEQIYASASTGQDGIYRLSGLPAGTYDLAVESPEGLYAADTLVQAIPGKRVIVSLAINKGIQEGQQGEGEKPPEEQKAGEEGKKVEEGQKEGDPNQPAEPEPEKKSKKGKSFWRSPWAALVGIVPAAILLGFAANAAAGNDDNEPNPMTPGGN
ncbi:MAG TPA: carboxypeptidase-like regulatory domain-containing protein [Candidatus Polarisedimenticolia bacterium]|jgi:hypothetical protein